MKLILRFSGFFGVGGLLALAASACSGESPSGSGTAGTGNVAGSSGAGGAPSGGSAGMAGTPSTGGSATAGSGTAGSGTAGSGTAGSGTAGTGGSGGGAGGSGGAAGGGGGATGGLPGAMPSAGCGKAAPAQQTLGTFVKYDETITASALVTAKWQPRDYWVWLPPNYDNKKPYPVVYVGPGCGGKGNNAIPIQNASGNDAIVVGLDYSAAATGRECFMTEAFPDPEVNYVEETVAHVDEAFCIDKSRRFIEGFSSGSWISYLMGCVDGGPGNLFKGQANATGNWQGSLPDTACKGPTAYFGAHDMGDPDGYNKYPGGRDHVLKMNGCTMPVATTPYDPGPMVKAPNAGSTVSCVQYMGCKAPTVFCTTTGLGHNDQVATGLSTFGAWKFWMSLP